MAADRARKAKAKLAQAGVRREPVRRETRGVVEGLYSLLGSAQERDAELRRLSGVTVIPRQQTYAKGSGNSFIKDVALHLQNSAARERLRIHASEQQDEVRQREAEADAGIAELGFEVERRAIGGTAAGAEFLVPLTMLEDWAPAARPSRVFADSMPNAPLPKGTSSINIPRASVGSSTAIQPSPNSAVSATDMVTNQLVCPVVTLAGQVDLSLQLLEQSPSEFLDAVVTRDLVLDLSAKLDNQLVNGTGSSGQMTGILNVSGINTATYTSGSPVVSGLWSALGSAFSKAATARLLPATAWFLSGRRFAWIASALDGNSRPFMVPDDDGVTDADGYIFGRPVYIDGNIPLTLGAGSNQDIVILTKADDGILWTSDVHLRVTPNPNSGTLTSRVTAHMYAASAFRYSSGAATIGGTGLTPPTFP